MNVKLRWCLKTDLFTHKENIYTDKNINDFYSFISYWCKNRLSDFKCIHIYINDEICHEENEYT